ncbi:MAG: hypothetical protein ABJN95_17365 [Maribacter sp.]|uniref:hypothetical protein n=1 Tax=Maribacter sp. TaxID=1897614 RepID=UPI00329683E3
MIKNSKHHIALFYVALILFFKVAGLHALTPHNDDTDVQHCEICHITTAVSFIPLIESDATVVPQKEHLLLEQKLNSTAPKVVFNNKFLSSNQFTRPPPQFS